MWEREKEKASPTIKCGRGGKREPLPHWMWVGVERKASLTLNVLEGAE
jgi:hypothetical protein